METRDCILGRRSIRKFTDQVVVREEIEKSFVRPNEISIDKVSRFNELVRKHFPPDNLDRI